MWGEYQRRWHPANVPQSITPPTHPAPGEGTRDRYLDRLPTTESKQRATGSPNREREMISPAMRDVESQDPDRQLTGFDYRLKGRDRIKEKVCDKY